MSKGKGVRTRSRAVQYPEMLIVDPTSGLSGDMFLGCLFALGVDHREVERILSGIPGIEPFRIKVGKVKRRGFSLWRARVQCASGVAPRDLKTILSTIKRSKLENKVKALATDVFRELGRVEGVIHGVCPEDVHFHEVGAVDSIVDIIGAVLALSKLRFPRLFHRPFRLGSGTVSISHGEIPVPAPATLALLEGRTVMLDTTEGEVVTPTGAALMRVLAEELPSSLPFTPLRVVHATGTRESEPGPGILRVIAAGPRGAGREIVVIRTTIDDMNPELYGHVQDTLFEGGALDVYLTQVIMKKGRPGVLITVLCDQADRRRIVDQLFRETTTLGVRIGSEGREELERWTDTVDTPFGTVEVKFGRLPGGEVKYAPEYESCRRIAATEGVPAAEVFRAAQDAARDIVQDSGRTGTQVRRKGQKRGRT
jgi:uncharacterized protein (TIGR00299 family) protein